jgi:hypothetical protein
MAIPDSLRDAFAHSAIPLVRATIIFVGHAAATVAVLTSMKTGRDGRPFLLGDGEPAGVRQVSLELRVPDH